MVKPGKGITVHGLVEAYCAVVDTYMVSTTINPEEANCYRCCSLMKKDQKKFAENKNSREAQEG